MKTLSCETFTCINSEFNFIQRYNCVILTQQTVSELETWETEITLKWQTPKWSHKKQQTNRLIAGRGVIQQPLGNVAMSIFYVQSMLNYEKNHKDT